MVLYADSVFLSELAADFLLLLATDRLCGGSAPLRRLLSAALLGAAYSLLCLLAGGFWALWPMKLLAGAGMLLLAYGPRRSLPRRAAVFLGVSAAFAGVVLALSRLLGGFGGRQQLLSFLAAYALLGLALRFGAATGERQRAVLRQAGRSVALTALLDTGNALRDPLTGAPVLVTEEAALYPLLPSELRAALRESRGRPPEERLELLWSRGLGNGFRLLPYRSVGVEGGLLLCFRPQAAELAGRPVPGLTVALSPTPIRGPFEAVVGTT